MFIQNLIPSFQFIGILLLRILAGIILGFVWFIAIAGIFHFTGENVVSQHADIGPHRGLYDYFDSKYHTGNPIFTIVACIAHIGQLACIVLGILWGIFQSRFNLTRWLYRRKVRKLFVNAK